MIRIKMFENTSSHIQFAIRNWNSRLYNFVTYLEAIARALGVVRKHGQLLDRFQHRNQLLHQSHSGWRAPTQHTLLPVMCTFDTAVVHVCVCDSMYGRSE